MLHKDRKEKKMANTIIGMGVKNTSKENKELEKANKKIAKLEKENMELTAKIKELEKANKVD